MKVKLFQFAPLLVVFIGCLQLTQALTEAELQAMATKFSQECVKENGLTADQVKQILNENLSMAEAKQFTDKMKCFLLCFYKKVGILDGSGKPNSAVAKDFFEYRFSKHKDKVKPALAKCGSTKGDNACDSVYKFELCMLEAIEGK